MSERINLVSISGLGELLAESDSATSVGQRVTVNARELTGLSLLVIRGSQSDPVFVHHTTTILGESLPREPSTCIGDEQQRLLWISPDEWWVLLKSDRKQAVLSALDRPDQVESMQVLDNSGSLCALEISGLNHLTVLRHLVPYDVESITVNSCINTVMTQAGITVVRPDPARVYLLFRRSYAGWIWQLIKHAARPYGLRVSVADNQASQQATRAALT